MIGGFTPWARALGDVDFPPILLGAGELIRAEHGVCNNYDEHHVSDGVVFPFGLGLDISEVIDVFWDALANEIVLLRVVL